MSTSLSLSVKVPTDSLKTIASALPSSLANNVISSQVEQVFVWIIKDSESAAKIVSILRDSGFKNIKLDSKGTTITALAGSLINNTSTPEDVTADTCTIVGTHVNSCANLSPLNCGTSYVLCSTGGSGGTQCMWTNGTCSDAGCSTCS